MIDTFVIIIGFFLMSIIASMSISVGESDHKRLHAYRKKYGFDRTCEIADLSKSFQNNTAKLTKRLDRRQRIFGKNVNADMPRQINETVFQFIKRRMYKI